MVELKGIIRQHTYVTLKMYERDSSHGERETQIYKHLASIKSNHTGSLLVRAALDDFQVPSADGSHYHQCLIHPPLAMSLFELRNKGKAKIFTENLLKPTLIHILLALDFLHTEAHVVHTGMIIRSLSRSLLTFDRHTREEYHACC